MPLRGLGLGSGPCSPLCPLTGLLVTPVTCPEALAQSPEKPRGNPFLQGGEETGPCDRLLASAVGTPDTLTSRTK